MPTCGTVSRDELTRSVHFNVEFFDIVEEAVGVGLGVIVE
jgi:hypothetical protein